MPPLCARSDSAYSSTSSFQLRPTEGNALSAFAPCALRIPPPELAVSHAWIGRGLGLHEHPRGIMSARCRTLDRGPYPLTIVSSISPVTRIRVPRCRLWALSALAFREHFGAHRHSRCPLRRSCPFIGLSAGCRNHPQARSRHQLESFHISVTPWLVHIAAR